MGVATATATAAASSFSLHAHMLSPPTSARTVNPNRTVTSPPSSSLRASLSTNFLSPFPATGSVSADLSGLRLRPDSLNPASLSRSKPKRGVVTMVIPFSRGSAWEQPPPDLASYLYKNRIVYLGMSLVPSVTELILAEFLYLQYEDAEKPIYLYVNSTGTTKGGEKLGYETEAFAIYDVMGYVKPPIFTLCVGNAWGEAALLLAAGATGNRSALPSSTIMIRQVRCTNPQLCTDNGVNIVVTDYGEGHNTDFILSPRAYARMARSDTNAELFAYGVVDVEYQRIPCRYDGYKLQFKVHEHSRYPSYLAIVILYQAGKNEILAIDIWREDCKKWIGMRRAYGAVFDMANPPLGAISLRFQVRCNAGLTWVQAPNVIPSDWKAGVAYQSDIQLH